MTTRLLPPERPVIVLVGRTNVGKSSLLNRIAGKPLAIVSPLPATTRDLLQARVNWQGRDATIIDTGGLSAPPLERYRKLRKRDPDPFHDIIGEKVQKVIASADHLCLVTDVATGVTEEDSRWARSLRSLRVPTTLVVNKVDRPSLSHEAAQFYRLGIPNVFRVSAANGSGIGDLLDHLFDVTSASSSASGPPEARAQIVIIGKPNVGKSSLFNAMLGQEVALVSALPHTTREPLERALDTQTGIPMALFDTAGIRRRAHQSRGVERVGVARTCQTLARSDVAILVLDPFVLGVSHQDQELGRVILEARSAAVIAVNKSDEGDNDPVAVKKIRASLWRSFPHLSFAPMVFISTKEKKGLRALEENIVMALENHRRRCSSDELAMALRGLVLFPKANRKKSAAALSLHQTSSEPPEFEIHRSSHKKTPFAIIRIIERRLREHLPLEGTPIVIHVERRKGMR